MLNLNKFLISGRVANVQVRDFQGSRFATVRLASSEKYKDRNGNECEDTLWLDASVSGNAVAFVEQYVGKGDLVFVEGRLKSRSYTDRDGNERTAFEIRCQSIQLIQKKADSAANSAKPATSVPTDEDIPF